MRVETAAMKKNTSELPTTLLRKTKNLRRFGTWQIAFLTEPLARRMRKLRITIPKDL